MITCSACGESHIYLSRGQILTHPDDLAWVKHHVHDRECEK